MSKKTKYLLILFVALIALSGLVYLYKSQVRVVLTTTTAHLSRQSDIAFPSVNKSELTQLQQTIRTVAHTQYDKHPVSYGATVLTYTQGSKEAWCADFVSWVMKESGQPLSNPNSGSWRIPGVLTLQDYYRQQDRYEAVDNYKPAVGDVAIYVGRHTFDLFSTQHAAIVVAVNGDRFTTVGGNEGGRIRLNDQLLKTGENGLVGFGRLDYMPIK